MGKREAPSDLTGGAFSFLFCFVGTDRILIPEVRSGDPISVYIRPNVSGSMVILDLNFVVVAHRVFEAKPFGWSGETMCAIKALFTGRALGF